MKVKQNVCVLSPFKKWKNIKKNLFEISKNLKISKKFYVANFNFTFYFRGEKKNVIFRLFSLFSLINTFKYIFSKISIYFFNFKLQN